MATPPRPESALEKITPPQYSGGMKTFLSLVALASLLLGCASQKVLPFVGEQKDWPVADGSFMRNDCVVPVFYGYPPKPYAYVAQVEVRAQDSLVDVIAQAAHAAQSRGGDALLVLEDSDRPVGSVSSGSGYAVGRGNQAWGFGSSFGGITYGGVAKTIAIKFKEPFAWTRQPVAKVQPLMPSMKK
jgi:hypothetical protein